MTLIEKVRTCGRSVRDDKESRDRELIKEELKKEEISRHEI